LPNDANVLDHYGAGLTITHALDSAWTMKSITAARKLEHTDYIDIDATQFQAGDVLVDVKQSQISQEFQFIYNGGGPVRFVGGLYALKETIASHQEAYGNDLFFGTTFTRLVDDDQDMTSLAAFGSVDYDITSKLILTGGLRYTREEKDYFRTTTILSSFAPFTLPPFSPVTINPSSSWEDISPNLTLTWKPEENRTYYAKVSKGFKSGGFNGRANSLTEPLEFEPEKLWSYELGAKYSLLGGRLTANSAVFYNQYKDFQARVSRGDVFSASFGVVNAGELEQYGAELELFFRPVRALSLQAQVGWLNASYGEFFDPRFLPLANPLNDRSWQTPAFSPELTARLGAVYTFMLDDMGTLDVGGDANFRSKMALAVDNANFTTHVEFPGMFQDDFWLFNARVAWNSMDGRYTIALVGKNLTDEVYRVDAQEFSNVGGIRTAYYGAPQTFQINVAVNF
jgi:iron complex outermembrane receptor protein